MKRFHPHPLLLAAALLALSACQREPPAKSSSDLLTQPWLGEAEPLPSATDRTAQLRPGGRLQLTREEPDLRAGLLVGGERGYWIVDLPAPASSGFRGQLRLDYRGSVDGDLRLGAILHGEVEPRTLAAARRVTAGTWQSIAFDLEDDCVPGQAISAFTLHPPAAEVGETALRKVTLLAPARTPLASIDVGGVRRRALLVGVERTLSWPLRGSAGDTLEIGLALHPDRSSAEGIGVRLIFTSGGQDSLLLARRLGTRPNHWSDFAFVLPGPVGADGTLKLESFVGAESADARSAPSAEHRNNVLLVSGLRVRKATALPNVLLIVIDTLRADGLSSAGNPVAATPSLDAFIDRECVRFDQAHATATWTHPSLGSILSGLMPQRHGLGMALQGLSHFRADTQLLAQRLRDQGYATAAVTNNLIVSSSEGFASGYDSFDERPLRAPDFYGAQRVSQSADEWLATRAGPFHLYLHYFDPHDRYQAPPPWTDRFVPDVSVEVPDGVRAGLVTPLQARMFSQGVATGTLPSSNELTYLRGLYDGEIGYSDRWIGWLLERMRARGQLRNTLVIVCSDHGEEFLEHERLKHGHSLYQELLQVPLAIRFPDAAGAGRRVGTPVSLLDLVPTVLAAAGIADDSLPGRDLRLRLAADAAANPIFALAPAGAGVGELPPHALLQCVLEGQLKLIRRLDPPQWTLFDLRADPSELRDLAATRPDDVLRLAALLDAAFADLEPVGAPELVDPAALEKLRALGYAH